MKKISLLLLFLTFCFSLNGRVVPAPLFNNGMVLQQKSSVRFWGWAKPNTNVTVKGSWNNKTVICKSNAQGEWETHLTTPMGSYTPYMVTLSDGEKLIINNVLIGEVWVGSGQSNMEMSLAGRNNRVIENVNKEILNANNYNGKLHIATVKHSALNEPADTVTAKWENCTSANAVPWSAVCYFFGSTLIDALHCPVGMISSCWGGTSVESWSPANILPTPNDEKEKKDFSVRYNGMIHPIEGYTIRGFIWYQGEDNVSRYTKYASQLGNMIMAWRKQWKQSNLPFYEVEIAPYIYDGAENTNAAFLREAQCEVSHNIPNTGMVSTNDLVKDYELRQIHPMMKREVGERLAFLALDKDYKIKGLFAESPEYKNMKISGNKIYLYFTNAKSGFNRFEGFKGFEICGADKQFYPAQVSLENTTLVVSSPKVPNPTAVHYCFKNFCPGNTTNVGGMPIVPFRTDK